MRLAGGSRVTFHFRTRRAARSSRAPAPSFVASVIFVSALGIDAGHVVHVVGHSITATNIQQIATTLAMAACIRVAACLALLLGACVSTGLMAQTLYKSTDSNGRVIYSDKPVPGAVEIEGARSEPVDPENASRIVEERKKLRQQGEEFQQSERQRERALDSEVSAAQQRLEQAYARRNEAR